MNITQSFQKWGNGAGVRIPNKVAKAANWHINQQVSVSLQDTSIILTPVIEKDQLTLEAMLNGVTPELVLGELNWGEDVGVEKYE